MEAFYRMANYPLIKCSDMSTEVKEEALDICLLACEKHSGDIEKCTQVLHHIVSVYDATKATLGLALPAHGLASSRAKPHLLCRALRFTSSAWCCTLFN